MQTLICGLIILAALFYVANRWLPPKIKQRFMHWTGKASASTPSNAGCSNCSSCGNCGSNDAKIPVKLVTNIADSK